MTTTTADPTPHHGAHPCILLGHLLSRVPALPTTKLSGSKISCGGYRLETNIEMMLLRVIGGGGCRGSIQSEGGRRGIAGGRVGDGWVGGRVGQG